MSTSSSVKRPQAVLTPSNFRTPVSGSSMRRKLGPEMSGGSPSVLPRTPRVVLSRVVQVNDDEAERRQRRLQKNMGSMISPGCHTPRGISGSAHGDRSRAVESSSSSLSDAQLSEHYTNCIKLSTQNKISSKNAFGLHLIDHMLKLLRMRGEMSNFQIASSTLDAGAKIYAGRVDAIYNEIFKVLGSLGRDQLAAISNKGGEEDGVEAEEEEGVKEKRGKRSKKSAVGSDLMIEKDPSNLIGDFDRASQMDPLFQKTAAAFDEGGVQGLLLNNLIVQDDGCSLNLDGSQRPVLKDQPAKGITVYVEEGLLDKAAIQTRQICPTFANFKFNCTDPSVGGGLRSSNVQRMELGGEGRSGGVGQDADFTMLDCPPTAPDDDGADDDHDFGDAPAMDADADQTFVAASRGDTTCLGTCNDNQVAQFIPAVGGAESGNTTAPVPGGPGLGDLCLTELIAPSDYSYFNPSVLASWAGPQHWKFRPRNTLTKKPLEKETKVKRRKASTSFKMDFAKTPAKTAFATGKAATQLSKAALSKLDTSLTTLPRDTHTDTDVLHRLFSQPKWKIRRRKKATGVVDKDLEGDWYDYENTNDQLNYIPPADNGTESDDAEEMDDSPPDFAAQEYFNEMAPPPMEVAAGGVELGGANLVVHPHKVDQVRVDYARSSKKIDIKTLKSKMWDVISHPTVQEQEQELRLEDKADLSDFSIFTS